MLQFMPRFVSVHSMPTGKGQTEDLRVAHWKISTCTGESKYKRARTKVEKEHEELMGQTGKHLQY